MAATALTGTILSVDILAKYQHKRAATAKLRQEQQTLRRFRSMIAHSADLIAILDTNGCIRFISPSVESMVGYSPDEVEGRRVDDFLHAGDLAQVRAGLSEGGDGSCTTLLDVRARHRDGSWRWLEITASNRHDDADIGGVLFNARDATESRATVHALRASEEQFRQLFADHPLPMWVYDRETLAFLEVNTAAIAKYGYSREAFLGMTIFDIRPASEADRLRAHLARERPEVSLATDWKHQLHDGRIIDVEGSSHTFTFNGRPAVLVVAQDVTQRVALELELVHRASHDPLTDLPNRRTFQDQLLAALDDDESVAVLFIDLDDFKVVNDSLGHRAGDELLLELTHRLRSALRPGDILGRFGGDEFTILFRNSDSPDQVMRFAETLAQSLRAPIAIADRDIFATPSIGIACSRESGLVADDLLRAADMAMYAAKRNGKDRCVMFDEGMDQRAWQRLELGNDLHRAIERAELSIDYQPIVDIPTGRIVAVESLARWHHPRLGLISPAVFIPLAEQNGTIREIGQWVLTQACHQAREWQQRIPEHDDLRIMVNISTRQLQDSDFAASVRTILTESGLLPAQLVLEITETAAINDLPTTWQTLREVRDLGVTIAIDDFGTGYAGLGYLREFPVGMLKIDKSYIAGLGPSSGTGTLDRAMVRSIVAFADSLGTTLVAEGIETEWQWQQVADLGCQLGQGFLFARPQPASELSEYLQLASSDGVRGAMLVATGTMATRYHRSESTRKTVRILLDT